ncbi:MAG: acetate--CoA ligase family protein [Thermoplasmatota archaeon]
MGENLSSGLGHLFEPRSVAVVGASERPEKIGYKVLANIIADGYRGRVYPVNPRHREILGLRCYGSVDDVPGEVDLAVIVVPAEQVPGAVRACASKGVGFLAIITSGFSEVGRIDEERRVLSLAREGGARVLGPNIFGIYSARASLNATFGPGGVRSGGVAIVTQSGALGVAMMGKTALEGMGLSAVVSVGNKADLDEAELVEHLVRQEDTRIILLYIEGVRRGERLVETLERASRAKPIVVIKSGRSRRGAAAAASHTGSLAGSDEVFECIMKQCGVMRAETVDEALAWCKVFDVAGRPQSEDTLIITNGGGIGVLATDACERYGVRLSDDLPALREAFSPLMPSFGSPRNPVDLTGQASADHYRRAFDAALDMAGVGAVVSLYCETAVLVSSEFTPVLEGAFRRYRERGKPLVFCLFGGRSTEEIVQVLRSRDVPVFTEPYKAVSCVGALYRYVRGLAAPVEEPVRPDIRVDRIEETVGAARADGRRFLYALEARRVMEAAGVPMPKSSTAWSVEEAVASAKRIGLPVAMKVVSRDILHKSDVGGVALDLESEREVVEAYEAILHNCRARAPRAVVEGVEVMEMVPPGVELIVGARRDPSFGPVVMVGLGGIYVEVLRDVSFRALPIGRRQALSMIKDTKAYTLLLGVRGEERRDIEGVMNVVFRVGEVLRRCPGISDIEVNPLRVYPRGSRAVDVRILLSESSTKEGSDAHE